jgi:hypothetical protein
MEKVRTGAVDVIEGPAAEDEEAAWSPVVIRRKVFASVPMTVDDALYYMELVGHDFYLFMDAESDRPSVVYRRKGWDYGVISLDDSATELQEAATTSRKMRGLGGGPHFWASSRPPAPGRRRPHRLVLLLLRTGHRRRHAASSWRIPHSPGVSSGQRS